MDAYVIVKRAHEDVQNCHMTIGYTCVVHNVVHIIVATSYSIINKIILSFSKKRKEKKLSFLRLREQAYLCQRLI